MSKGARKPFGWTALLSLLLLIGIVAAVKDQISAQAVAVFVLGLIGVGILYLLAFYVYLRWKYRLLNRAMRRAHSGDVEGAIAFLQEQLYERGPSAEVLSTLAAFYSAQGNWSEALRCTEEAEQLGDCPGLLNNKGLALWKTGRTSEARATFARATERARPDLLTVCNYGLLLAEVGDAKAAEEQLRRAEGIFANERILGGAELRRTRKNSLEELRGKVSALREKDQQDQLLQAQAGEAGPEEKAAAAAFEGPRRPPRSSPPRRRRRLLFPLLGLGALAAYLGAAIWIGQDRKVFLVNGTSRPYVVFVAGRDSTLPARGAVPVRVAEGEVEVAFKDARPGLKPVLCTVETPFWSRPFASTTFVINPDRSALIVKEETVYEAKPSGKPASRPEFHFGQPAYRFSDIDYEFQEFPPQIQVKGGQAVSKWRVGLFPNMAGEARLQLLLLKVPAAERMEFCRHVLSLDPLETVFLYWLGTQLPPQPLLDFLQTRLDDEPPLIEWHRMYQSQMERTHPEQDLRPRYQRLLAQTKYRAEATYLLARVEPDWKNAKALFRQAAEGALPCSYAMYALGYDALSAGQFDEARRWLERARVGLGDSPLLRPIYYEALWAQGDLDRLLTALQADAKVPGLESFAIHETAKVYAARGDQEKARGALAVRLFSAQDGEAVDRELERLLACARRDVAAYLQAATHGGNAPSFEIAFLRDDLEAAAGLADQPPYQAATHHALLYLAASRSRVKEISEREWKTLLDLLGKGGREERKFADLLAGRQPLVVADLEQFVLDPKSKRVLLAVLAQRHPDRSRQLLTLARKLDYERDAVSLCLHHVLKDERGFAGP